MFYLVLALFPVMACIYFFIYFKKKEPFSDDLLIKLQELESNKEILSEAVRVLRKISGYYYVTLNENGFQELCRIESAVQALIELGKYEYSDGNLATAAQIADFLSVETISPAVSPKFWKISGAGSHAVYAQNWKPRAATILNHITARLESSVFAGRSKVIFESRAGLALASKH